MFATVEAITVDEQGVETCAPLTEEAFAGQLAQSGSGWMEVLNKSVLLGIFIRPPRPTKCWNIVGDQVLQELPRVVPCTLGCESFPQHQNHYSNS